MTATAHALDRARDRTIRAGLATVEACAPGCPAVGCTVVGPDAVRYGRPAYDEAIAEANRQQIPMSVIHHRYGRRRSRSGWFVLLWIGFSATGGAASPVSGDTTGYVGSAACRACHAEQFEAWGGSHHDLAMQPANGSTVLGDFNDRVFEHRGVRTRFYRKGEGFMVETQGADGRDHEHEISYTFGGIPLQQYLVGFPDGRYQALTVAWDSRATELGREAALVLALSTGRNAAGRRAPLADPRAQLEPRLRRMPFDQPAQEL